MQGAQILRNEAYIWYAAVTKNAAQRSSWGVFATPAKMSAGKAATLPLNEGVMQGAFAIRDKLPGIFSIQRLTA
jgi:hypothetical protein